MRTARQLEQLTANPPLTLQVLEVWEQNVLRTEADANRQFQANLAARKAHRAYLLNFVRSK